MKGDYYFNYIDSEKKFFRILLLLAAVTAALMLLYIHLLFAVTEGEKIIVIREDVLKDVEEALRDFLGRQRGNAVFISVKKLFASYPRLRRHSRQAVGLALYTILSEKSSGLGGWKIVKKMKNSKLQNKWVLVRNKAILLSELK